MGAARSAERLHQDPRDRGRHPGHRERHRRGDQHQRNAHVQRRHLQAGGARVHRGAAPLQGVGGRPLARGQRGELLRQPRRHQDRQVPGGEGRPRRPRGSRSRGDRQRQDGVRGLQRDLRRRRLRRSAGRRRARPALPVGQHQHEEPRLPRRHLRRGADRSADGQHHAARHDHGLHRPRRREAHARHGRGAGPPGSARGGGQRHQHRSRDGRADRGGRRQLLEELRRAHRDDRVEAQGARSGMSELNEAIASRLACWTDDRVAERLWAKDGSLWAASGKPADEVAAWLGWLDLPDAMAARVSELEHLARDVREDGYRRAAVPGMGGSSLAPELFSRVFGWAGGPGGNGAASTDGLELRILDSTHPDVVRGFRSWASEGRTLFCVSSKSGSTTEPNAYQAAMGEIAPALDFVAITDPGTSLADLARAQEFRAIVEAPQDVGGRYSALTVFGLVPAALNGVDLAGLLDRAELMAEQCRTADAAQNPGLTLGAAIGEAALAGRDKLTIVTSERLAALGDWAEQLVAESTGKQGKGIIPVVGEPLLDPGTYGDDRAFVFVTLAGDTDTELGELADALASRGHPVQRIELADPLDIGAEFVRWEIATAAAGIVLGIDPFDQPNVQESKDATKELLEAFRTRGALPQPAPLVSEAGIAATADPASLGDSPVSVDGAVSQLLTLVEGGRDYLAILAYLPPDDAVVERLQRIRVRARDAIGVATTLGFGPRFLHSTGQLHKGGPDTGVFLQLTAEPSKDLPIAGWDETFGTLVAAQALGDLTSLQRRGRRALRLHLGDVDE